MALRPRHLRRYRQITEIMIRHGFGAVVAQLGLDERLDIPRRLLRRQPQEPLEPATAAIHARQAIEELGSTFVKLGQILSTRPDLLPPDFIHELSKLQDDVPPGPWEPVQALIETELGQSLAQLFRAVDPTPIAAASLAQVYAALLPDGTPVVIKAQRPGVDQIVNTDLEILNDLAALAKDRLPDNLPYDLVELADEFSIALLAELDYRREGRNADLFSKNFAEEPQLYVPKVYWEYSTRRILVQERISGIKVSDVAALDAAGYNRERLALYAARIIIKEVLEDGFFHADPHPGNLLILPGEVIGMIDFGTMGHLDSYDRGNLVRLYIMLIQMDVGDIVDQLVRMGIADPRLNRKALQRDLRRLLFKYKGLPLDEISVNELMAELEPIIYKHQLRIPSDLWLLIKTLVIMEGVGKALAPEFDIFSESEPYVKKFFMQMWLPTEWGPSALRSASGWMDLFANFPSRSTRIMERVEQGELSFQVDVPGMDEVAGQINQIANRIILGVLLAALIVALAMLIPTLDLTWPWGLITWLIVVGFFSMSFLAVWLVIWILRTNRRK